MNNLAIQPTPVETELRISASELCERAAEVIILTRPDLSQATDLVKAIKTRVKNIEDERTKMVKPFNDGVKQINDRFKVIRLPLEEAETELKGKMLVFQKEEERRAEEIRRKQEAAQREQERLAAEERARATPAHPDQPDAIIELLKPINEPALLPAVPPPASSYKPTTYGQTGATSTVKKVWAFELQDIVALATARPDLVQVDQVRINQEIRGKGGVIPGLNIFEKDVLQVR